jgi:hypothetical protein
MGKVGCHVRTTIDLLLRDELQPDWRAGDCASTADGKELGVGSCELVEDRRLACRLRADNYNLGQSSLKLVHLAFDLRPGLRHEMAWRV